MKNIFTTIFIGFSLMFNIGCTDDRRTLSFYTWDDYIDPELITEFEQENNCRVVINVFDSNESMYAKLLFSQEGYDVVLPSSYQIVMMKKNNMLEKINYSLLSNVVSNFDTKYNSLLLTDISGYSVPYAFSMTGIAYRADKIKPPITSWKQMEYLKITDGICLFSDMRETFGAALKCLGYSINSTNETELLKALELAKKWKNITIKFDNEAWKTGIASGEFNVVMAYNSDIFQIMSDATDKSKIKFSILDEGIVSCFDEFVIIKQSKNKDLAYKFIDFMYRPEVAKRNIEYILAIMPNKAAIELLPDNMKTNELIVPSTNTLNKCEIINCLNDNVHKFYVKMWDELKASK
jgi:spermidine/putrescine transport system substrate-binding protein